MEGDKRRTKDDTWKSEELKKHLKVSRSGSHSEDRRHRQRKAQDGDNIDTDEYNGVFQDQDRPRGKEKMRYKSSERHRDERKDKGREKDHPREWDNREKDHLSERHREKIVMTGEKYAREEKHISGKGREKHRGKEKEKRHRKDDPGRILVEETVDAYREKRREHHERRGSKDHADHSKLKSEEKEKKHSERKNGKRRTSVDEVPRKQEEERDCKRKTKKDHEPTKERSRRHREKEEHKEKKEHREKKEHSERKEHSEKKERSEKNERELSLAEGNEKFLKLRSSKSAREGEEKNTSRRHKEQSHHESRFHRENQESQQEESEEKKRDHKYSEYRSQRKSSRHEDDTDHQHERNTKEKVKKHGKREREDGKPHRVDNLTSLGPHHKRKADEEKENTLNVSTSRPDPDYDYPVNYEDDFEDYEDDFDDIDDDEGDEDDKYSQEQEKEKEEAKECVRKIHTAKNAEIEEIQRAINAENEKIENFYPKQTKNEFIPKEFEKSRKERQDQPARSPVSGKFIDFQTARQRQSIRKIVSQQKKRSLELLRLIDLDFSVCISLLDLPSVNEYDMYIRNFGKINTKQAYVQWNEDNLDRDVQTEEVEIQEKWTQHPGETSLVSGGPRSSNDVSALTVKIDSQRLANFLRSACQVIEVLLEEDQVATQPRRNLRSRPSSLSISDRCFQLNTDLPFLHGRKISHLHISHVQRQALLSVHELPEKSSDMILDSKYIICVWNVWQPSSPQKLLSCESQVTSCCFSPSKAILVFVGTIDGSVLVWDLREDSRMHQSVKINETEWIFRSPTFSTDGVFTTVNHTGPVLSVEPVSTSVFKEQNCGLSYLSSPEEMLGLSFQIASMDENGTLSLWVVVELQKGDLAGSQNDLGLIPGGKIKLVHSSTVQLNCSFPLKDTMFQGIPQTLNIKFLPSNPNHFFVGTDVAIVSHGTRHDLRVPPKWFKPQQGAPRSTRVNAIDFSPFGKPIFLVGCSDGSIRLHQMTSELPLMQWNNSTTGQSIVALYWALTRPAVFFVLDATSVVYIWDLLENDLSPVAKQPIWSDKVLTMAVLGEPEKPSGLLGIALAKESGIIDIKYVKKKWSQPQPDESEKLNFLLQQAL